MRLRSLVFFPDQFRARLRFFKVFKFRLFLQDTVKPLSSEVNTYLAVPVNQAFTYQLAIDNLFSADLIKQSICFNTRFPVYVLEAKFIYISLITLCRALYYKQSSGLPNEGFSRNIDHFNLCTVKMGTRYKSRKKARVQIVYKRRNYLNNTVYNDLAASRGRGGGGYSLEFLVV